MNTKQSPAVSHAAAAASASCRQSERTSSTFLLRISVVSSFDGTRRVHRRRRVRQRTHVAVGPAAVEKGVSFFWPNCICRGGGVRRGAEAAGDQRGLVVRLRGAASVSAAGRQPRSLLPAGPQRAGKSCSFFVLTTNAFGVLFSCAICGDASTFATVIRMFCFSCELLAAIYSCSG
jgi:hypothetical protein